MVPLRRQFVTARAQVAATVKPGPRDLVWMAAGAVLLLALALIVFHFQAEPKASAELALAAKRLELLNQIRFGLAAASEAEKSAVLAVTDEDSQTFADQARAASAGVEQARKELAELVQSHGSQHEADLLEQFSQSFAELRRVDDELLGLAVKNTNLKAASLTFGPAADALHEMEEALAHLVAQSGDAPDAGKVAKLALGAEIAALRIDTLLAPHVAEESDAKMDELEARMTRQDQDVRRALADLAALPALAGNRDLASAGASYDRFSELRREILALSRENTNVRSTTISLSRKRGLLKLSQDALAALQQAIEQGPGAGTLHGAPGNPR